MNCCHAETERRPQRKVRMRRFRRVAGAAAEVPDVHCGICCSVDGSERGDADRYADEAAAGGCVCCLGGAADRAACCDAIPRATQATARKNFVPVMSVLHGLLTGTDDRSVAV